MGVGYKWMEKEVDKLVTEIDSLSKYKSKKFRRLLRQQPTLVQHLVEFVIESRNFKLAARLVAKGLIRGHCRRHPEHKEEDYSSLVNSELGISIGLPYVLLSLRVVYHRFFI